MVSALSNEWVQLATGNNAGVESTNTIWFFPFNNVPKNKKVTYACFECDHHPLKDKNWKIWIVVYWDKLDYKYDSGAPVANILEMKLSLNSVMLDASWGACFCSMDLKYMFLKLTMDHYKYVWVPFKYFLDNVQKI